MDITNLNTSRSLAKQAVLYLLPVYEMARMRAASSPRKNSKGFYADPQGGPESKTRWINAFSHSRRLCFRKYWRARYTNWIHLLCRTFVADGCCRLMSRRTSTAIGGHVLVSLAPTLASWALRRSCISWRFEGVIQRFSTVGAVTG